MEFATLYKKGNKGRFQTWSIRSEGNAIITTHGLEGGKLQTKTVTTHGKNIGKANETTDEQQAALEAEAKWTIQQKDGYFTSKEAAESFVKFSPMKAKNYNTDKNKVVYPCYQQPKLDGQRLMIDKNGNAWSKSGEPLQLPKHWEGLPELAKKYGGLDGEVYAGLVSLGGLSLQKIISAFRKENEDTHRLQYWIYDIPDASLAMQERVEKMRELKNEIKFSAPFVVLRSAIILSEEQGDESHQANVDFGYEGSCYRNMDGLYEFDKRSSDLIKRKPRQTAEARIISVEKDRNGNGVVRAVALNGEQVGVEFNMLMKKEAVPNMDARSYGGAYSLIGESVEYSFEDLSDESVPLKPVGERLREVGANGEAKD